VGAAAVARTWTYLADALRLEAPQVVPGEVPGLHPTRAARLVGADGRTLGAFGEVDPDVVEAYGLRQRVGYLTLSVDALLSEPRRAMQARDVSKFPASDMDLAFVVPNAVPAGAVRATLGDALGDLLESVWLFDVYRGERLGSDRRSLAFRLQLRAPDRTLADAELAEARQLAIDAIKTAHGGELRA
jgi:phenylalanyl-tRNA synthetase beta chain